ncbi:MAG TPA: cytochrome oxidase small assembly protein [Burkholderiaceae bacterium]|nr:cytochrome oxidase small assembly protein [Burkholderiaceae bacterium]
MESQGDLRRHNRRTALILATVALVFFVGVIARRWLFGG